MSASRVPEARALAAAFAASVASPATPVSGLVRTSGGAPEPGSALPSLRGLIAAKTAELAAASEARLSAVTTRLSAAEAQLREKTSELAATQAQFVQLLSDFKFNLKARPSARFALQCCKSQRQSSANAVANPALTGALRPSCRSAA